MKPNIFMSYSRREVGFVEDLTKRLEIKGYQVWLDYRSLVPGTPWAGQIDRGVDRSDVILLVVSKASMASQYVELEWRRVLTQNTKRIILLIFEAVNLPPELEKYEWVDFRGSYEAGIEELAGQLDTPVVEEHPAPETGFKVPRVVWWAFGLSLIAALLSLASWWSLFVPFFLAPLPYRILKRDFNITQVQAALWLLPIVSLLNGFAIDPDREGGRFGRSLAWFLLSVFVAPALVFVLRSKAMQRWGKPQASLSRFANPYKQENAHPKPVCFFVDHAPQDRRVADELIRVFQSHGHSLAMNIETAQAVIVLLSQFKTDTEADGECQTVFPVMLQTCAPSDKLSKVQWVDFRRGVRHLESMAKLLPDPARLLTALGVRPTGNQLVLPPIIMGMHYFLILLGVFIFGSLLKLWRENPVKFQTKLTWSLITLPLLGVATYFLIRALTHRRGIFCTSLRFGLALLGLGLLIFGHGIVGNGQEDQKFNMAEIYPFFAYIVGMPLMTLFLAFRFRDVRRWFPAKPPKTKRTN